MLHLGQALSTVLKLAWNKKIQLNNKQIVFNHDNAYEVMEKRRAYRRIKKPLKKRTSVHEDWIHWQQAANRGRRMEMQVKGVKEITTELKD